MPHRSQRRIRTRQLGQSWPVRCLLALGFAIVCTLLTRGGSAFEETELSSVTRAQSVDPASCGGLTFANGVTVPEQTTAIPGPASPIPIESSTTPETPNWFQSAPTAVQIGAYAGQLESASEVVEYQLNPGVEREQVTFPSTVRLRGNENDNTFVDAAVLEAPPQPSQGIPGYLCVRVDRVPQAGTFSGEYLITAENNPPVVLNVLLIVAPTPAVTVSPASWTEAAWVDCRENFLWRIDLDCRLAKILFGESDLLPESTLILDNTAPQSANTMVIVPPPTVYEGGSTQPVTDPPFLATPGSIELRANTRSTLTIGPNPSGIEPGTYSGTIELEIPDSQTSRLSVPASLTIQTGPIWVVTTLLTGILLARLLQWWEQTGSKRRRLFGQVDDIDRDSNDLRDGEHWHVVQKSLNDATRVIMKRSDEFASTAVALVATRLDLLKRLEVNQALAVTCVEEARTEIAQLADQVRLRLENDLDDQVPGLLDQIEQQIESCQGQDPLDPAVPLAGANATRPPEARRPSAKRISRLGLWIRNIVPNPFSGRTPFRYKLVGWLATTIVWCVLFWIGLEALYLNTSVVFTGDQPRQYIPILAWGFGTQAVSRTVSSLFPSKT